MTRFRRLAPIVFAFALGLSGCSKAETDSGPELKPVPTAPPAQGAAATAPGAAAANPHGMPGAAANPHGGGMPGAAANPHGGGMPGAAMGSATGKPNLAVEGDVATLGAVTMTMPKGWQGRPSASSMRAGEISIPAAKGDTEPTELIIYYFGNAGAGTVQANIERWVGQFSNDDGSPAEGTIEQKVVNEIPMTTVEVEGKYVAAMTPGAAEKHNKASYGMRAAIVEAPGGALYFKMVGPKKTVTEAEVGFAKMLASLKKK